MRQNPHVRICGGPGSATTLVYPTPDQHHPTIPDPVVHGRDLRAQGDAVHDQPSDDNRELRRPPCVRTAPRPSAYGVKVDADRSSRKNARTSPTNSSGSSLAAKWPPLGIMVKRLRL